MIYLMYIVYSRRKTWSITLVCVTLYKWEKIVVYDDVEEQLFHVQYYMYSICCCK